jgi:FkbM family methyltransferase
VKDFDPEPLQEDFVGYPIKQGITAVDLGGNIGMVTVYLSKKIGTNGKVYVYEPDGGNFKILNENVRLNGASNVEAIQKGIWNSDGVLDFYSGGNYTSSFQKTSYIEKKSGKYQVEHVPVTTLDKEVARLGINRLDLIKIDIEGSEAEALDGAAETIKRFHPDLIIETHIVKGVSTKDNVRQRIEVHGYRNIRVTGDEDMPTIFAVYQ